MMNFSLLLLLILFKKYGIAFKVIYKPVIVKTIYSEIIALTTGLLFYRTFQYNLYYVRHPYKT